MTEPEGNYSTTVDFEVDTQIERRESGDPYFDAPDPEEPTDVTEVSTEQDMLAEIQAGMTAAATLSEQIVEASGPLSEALARVQSATTEAREKLKALMEANGHKTIVGHGLQVTNAARNEFRITNDVAARESLEAVGALRHCLKLDPKMVEQVAKQHDIRGTQFGKRYQLQVKAVPE